MAFQKVLSVRFTGPYRGGGGEGSKADGFPPARGSAAQLSPCFEPLEGSRGSGLMPNEWEVNTFKARGS